MDAIDASKSALVLVDCQARLMPAIHDAQNVLKRAALLADAAKLLGLRVLGTEQNPSGLGPNVDAIRERCETTLAKTHFDACADGLLALLDTGTPAPSQVVIAGCEAHVCMMQTALGLLRAGKRVWVVENASGSRKSSDHAAAMRRLQLAGATPVTHEMVLFEWLADCRNPQFRDVLQLIKDAD